MTIESIAEKLSRCERIDAVEAKLLWEEAPLWLLSRLATEAKVRKSGDKVFYNKNFHLEPTNICLFECRFCSYRRRKGETGAWDYSMEEILEQVEARKESGATEIHIVGGVHPERDLYYYAEMIRRIKEIMPEVCVKAFTAVELHYMIRKAGLTIEEGLRLLKEAGMESIPGGGAEIFDERIRAEICPGKCSSAEWLEMHEKAHRQGFDSNATMLYGHIEKVEHRIDHLMRLRELQDKTGGFNAFIPLKFRSANNGLESLGETSVVDDMRTLAMSRLILDNVPHIKAYWVMYGKESAELALSFGADDIDGTIEDSTKIYSMAGAKDQRPRLTIAEIEKMCEMAGYKAVERDTHYNELNGKRKTENGKRKTMKKFWSWLKKHTIAYNVVVIALVFLGLAVVSFIAMALGTRHSARRTVPDFVGLRMTDAEYFAGRRDLQIIVNDSLHVSAYPGGVILDQLPKGGVVVKPGRKVYVTINSSRQRMVVVPYVAGRSLRQAKNMLETAGLTIDHLEYAEDIATNYVLAEFVNGEEVLEESELQAEMGSGVVLRVGVSAKETSTAVPQVLGRSLFEAKGRLWESGLNIGEIEFDEGMPALERNRARVYWQSLLPSEAVEYGERVSLRLTLDMAKVDSMIVVEEHRVEEALKAKMVADSIAKAEQRLLDSIANAQKAKPQKNAPQTEDNFFF